MAPLGQSRDYLYFPQLKACLGMFFSTAGVLMTVLLSIYHNFEHISEIHGYYLFKSLTSLQIIFYYSRYISDFPFHRPPFIDLIFIST